MNDNEINHRSTVKKKDELYFFYALERGISSSLARCGTSPLLLLITQLQPVMSVQVRSNRKTGNLGKRSSEVYAPIVGVGIHACVCACGEREEPQGHNLRIFDKEMDIGSSMAAIKNTLLSVNERADRSAPGRA